MWHKRNILQAGWLYHRLSYEAGGYNIFIRLGLLVLAAGMLVCLLILVPNCHLGVASWIGKNTMPVFLLHGFFMRCISAYGLFKSVPYAWRGGLVFGLAIGITLLLSSPPVVMATAPLMRWPLGRGIQSAKEH